MKPSQITDASIASTFAERSLRRAKLALMLGGAMHALLATHVCADSGPWGAPVQVLAFCALRLAAPILLLAAACEFTVRRIDEFVTARWGRLVRK